MKKIIMIFLFIFLTSTFAGLFFSTILPPKTCSELAATLIHALTAPSADFKSALAVSLLTNGLAAILMTLSMASRFLRPVPIAALCCKSFSVGVCSGLIHLQAPDNAFSLSLCKILPQNLLLLPAFIGLAAIAFYQSGQRHPAKGAHRAPNAVPVGTSRVIPDLKTLLMIAFAMLFAGCIVEAAFLQVEL